MATSIVTDIGAIHQVAECVGLRLEVLLYGLIQWTGWGKFLFERPDWAIIDRPAKPQRAALPAE